MNQVQSPRQFQQTYKIAKFTIQNLKNLVQQIRYKNVENQSALSNKIKELNQSEHSNYLQNSSLNIKLGSKNQQKKKTKIQIIRQNIIGFNTKYISPFNIELQSVYIDHTATSRPYKPIQSMVNYAKRRIADPHHDANYFGNYSTEMMKYAQSSLLQSFSADPQKYVVIPAGSGSTGAIQKTIRMIKMYQTPDNKPDIFLTPYQHHSNILPWGEFYETVNVLESDSQTDMLRIDKIQSQLLNCKNKNMIISVSAASNVTSQVTDLKNLNDIIKKVRKHKNIIFGVDCAAFCCHHELSLLVYDQIDFAYLSPHKNLGGSQTCGMLLVRKSVIKIDQPHLWKYGIKTFNDKYTNQKYRHAKVDIFNRQIDGTPPYLGFYRGALSFQLLKNEIGYDFIHQRQNTNTQLFIKLINDQNQKFKRQKLPISIEVYGNCTFKQRANVITMNIFYENEIMHHSFISLILADTFGIQLRSGCFCAGPYGLHLLNLDSQMSQKLLSIVQLGIIKARPGYVRLDLTFYLEKFQIEFIAKAIALTARYCRNMLVLYTICNDGQIKRHKLFKDTFVGMYSLDNFQIAKQTVKKTMQVNSERIKNRRITLQNQLFQGQKILIDPLKFLKQQMHKQILPQV